MSEMRNELAGLRKLRRHLMTQTGLALAIPALALFLLWDVRLQIPDARVLAAITVVLLSWVVVRTVADVATGLESPCPDCSEPFFGGIARVASALPIPPTECVHCRIDFDGLRPRSDGSNPAAG